MTVSPQPPQKPLLLDDKPLPPVEAPSAGFLLQLFVVPMIIVTIIVMVWLTFSWLAHLGSNPQELVRDLRKPNEASWQKALTLADLLRNPQHEDLKRNSEMATELANALEAQLTQQQADEASIRLRMFLCRSLGEFKVPEVLPALLRAAEEEHEAADIDVRRAALQALAVFAQNNNPQTLRHNERCLEVLRKAARERSDVDAERLQRAELRSTSAYVLGVIGGEDALDRLAMLLDDSYSNARYNAATGLSRHGDLRAVPVLLEMLDPDNMESARDEEYSSGKDWKRLQVINTGIRGAAQLAEKHSAEDLLEVTVALQAIVDSDLSSFGPKVRHGIRLAAQDALLGMATQVTNSSAGRPQE